MPVITPWECELGLGARVWESRYMTSPLSILQSTYITETIYKENKNSNSSASSVSSNVTFKETSIDNIDNIDKEGERERESGEVDACEWALLLEKVSLANPDNNDSSSDEEGGEGGGHGHVISLTEGQRLKNGEGEGVVFDF